MARSSAQAPISDAAVAAIRETLQDKMGRFGLARVTVVSGEDHDGDPVLLVNAEYRLSKSPVDSAASFAALNEVREKLLALGEERFPHIRHHFHERQRVLDLH